MITDFDLLSDKSCDKVEKIVEVLGEHPEIVDLILGACAAAVAIGSKKNV